MKTEDYGNHLESYGIDVSRGKEECERIFRTIFYGSEEERFYHTAGDDMGYMEDTGNHDARTKLTIDLNDHFYFVSDEMLLVPFWPDII